MGFRINTNIAALNAHNSATINNRSLDKSLGSLSSGLRINSAADDSSGLVIADSLRSQANALGQAVSNANDAIGIIQTADKAMDEQIKILDTIKTKAIQAASDGQSASSREAIQQDVNRLISSLNNIAQTTAFNGQSLLSGKYENKEFQVGAYSNQTVQASIGNTESVAIGNIQQTTDVTVLGGIVETTAAAKVGATKISVASTDLKGLAKGDIISFEGSASTYSVQNITKSTGTIELSVPLTEAVAAGANISATSTAANPKPYLELTATTSAGANGPSITFSPTQLAGVAVGDTLTYINSVGESADIVITHLDSTSAGSGKVSFTSTAAFQTAISGSTAALGRVYIKSEAATLGTIAVTANTDANLTSKTLTISTAALTSGYAKGDVIELATGAGGEKQQFVIDSVQTTSAGASTITLNNAIAYAYSVGSTITKVSDGADIAHLELNATMATGATSVVLKDTTLDMRGIAIGDTLTMIADDGSTENLVVSGLVTSTGTISFASALTLTAGISALTGGVKVADSASLGLALTSENYVQYTVEGTKIDGVQLTDASGNGTAGSGLGRVAEQINIMSDVTGVTAVAEVSETSNTAVAATAETSAAMTINGVTVLAAGTSLIAGDTDNKLIDAINSKSSETGVSASLVDGKLKLESDGRAMALTGFTNPTGITDGVIAGELVFTKNGSDPISISAKHFTDANLSNENTTAATTVGVNTTAFNLSDLVNGRVDDNGDGTVDAKDTIGLLRTREGANVAIDIVGKAISELDATRSGLGSAQNELLVTVNNISVTQVNVKAAESQIRDVDFAAESANFSRLNILAQSGSYAMSQANAIQQNVLRLLQ